MTLAIPHPPIRFSGNYCKVRRQDRKSEWGAGIWDVALVDDGTWENWGGFVNREKGLHHLVDHHCLFRGFKWFDEPILEGPVFVVDEEEPSLLGFVGTSRLIVFPSEPLPNEQVDIDPTNIALASTVRGGSAFLLVNWNVIFENMRLNAINEGGSNIWDEFGFVRDHLLSAQYKSTPEYAAEVAQRDAMRLEKYGL